MFLLHGQASTMLISITYNPNLLEGIQIFKGDAHIPKWLSPDAKKLIRRILDPNPQTRITMAEIKADEWFKQYYTPAVPDEEEEDTCIEDETLTILEVVCTWILLVVYIAPSIISVILSQN